jgi:signal transduction histidine kinase
VRVGRKDDDCGLRRRYGQAVISRPPPRDVVLAAVLTVLSLVETALLDLPDGGRAVLLTQAALFGGALAVRRVAPLLCAVTVAGVLAVGSLLGVAASEAVSTIPPVLLAAYGAGAYLRPPRDRIGVLVLLAGGTTSVLADTGGSGDVAFVAVLVLAPWLAGLAMRDRITQAAALEERAAALIREQELVAQEAVAFERLRIARDLHDVVAHAVSLMTMQSGAVRRLLPAGTEREQEVLRGVEQTGRAALQDMARMLGVLRQADEPSPLQPQPGIDALSDLVAQVGRSGLATTLRVEGQVRAVPPSLALSVYRIAQEALTNVLKHGGPAARAGVLLRYESDALSLEVVDDGRGGTHEAAVTGEKTTGGHGLVGMRERAAMFGGSLVAGAREDGGFHVAARLPFPSGAR